MGLLFSTGNASAVKAPAGKTRPSNDLLHQLKCMDELEIWRAVPGWPRYKVSNLGRVYSVGCFFPYSNQMPRWHKGRILVPTILDSRTGKYKQAIVRFISADKTHYMLVSRLVLLAFVGTPEPGQTQARHLDSDSLNNKLNNLTWGTALENAADMKAAGRSLKGIKNPMSKLDESKIIEIRKLCDYIVTGGRGGKSKNRVITIQQIADMYGVSRSLVKLVRSRKIWGHV